MLDVALRQCPQMLHKEVIFIIARHLPVPKQKADSIPLLNGIHPARIVSYRERGLVATPLFHCYRSLETAYIMNYNLHQPATMLLSLFENGVVVR